MSKLLIGCDSGIYSYECAARFWMKRYAFLLGCMIGLAGGLLLGTLAGCASARTPGESSRSNLERIAAGGPAYELGGVWYPASQSSQDEARRYLAKMGGRP